VQGVRAVIAESFERIHRSNLVGMGIIPLEYEAGETTDSLELSGHETFSVDLPQSLHTQQQVNVHVCLFQHSLLITLNLICCLLFLPISTIV